MKIAVRRFLQAVVVPSIHHGLHPGQILPSQGFYGVVGELSAEAVKVIAFFLIFAASQICQIVDGVDIVEGVPVAVITKPVGIQRLQLRHIFTGQAGVGDLSGPVGIVNTMTEVGQQSATVREAVENIAYIAALIAVNLSVMNLLPIPALDGGKIFFLMINQLSLLFFKKQIPAKFENYIHVAGFILLMGLMAFVMFQDVWKLFQ